MNIDNTNYNKYFRTSNFSYNKISVLYYFRDHTSNIFLYIEIYLTREYIVVNANWSRKILYISSLRKKRNYSYGHFANRQRKILLLQQTAAPQTSKTSATFGLPFADPLHGCDTPVSSAITLKPCAESDRIFGLIFKLISTGSVPPQTCSPQSEHAAIK